MVLCEICVHEKDKCKHNKDGILPRERGSCFFFRNKNTNEAVLNQTAPYLKGKLNIISR